LFIGIIVAEMGRFARFIGLIAILSALAGALPADAATSKGSGDKFGDAQIGLTYGVYKPTNTLGLRLSMFQVIRCQPGMENWVAASYGFGKKRIDVYETKSDVYCSDAGLSKEVGTTTIKGITARVFVYCDPMRPKVYAACTARDIAKVGGYLLFAPSPKLTYKPTKIQVQGVGGITFRQLRTVALSLV